jgi:hypothetical protein
VNARDRKTRDGAAVRGMAYARLADFARTQKLQSKVQTEEWRFWKFQEDEAAQWCVMNANVVIRYNQPN